MPQFASFSMTQLGFVHSSGGWVVGAPVDPRYGQSCEVGMMADFGYNAARDALRLLVALSVWLVAVVDVARLIQTQFKACSRDKMDDCENCCLIGQRFLETISDMLVVPAHVNLIGMWVVDNFGGLGGGL